MRDNLRQSPLPPAVRGREVTENKHSIDVESANRVSAYLRVFTLKASQLRHRFECVFYRPY
jgi:hypothetical protein